MIADGSFLVALLQVVARIPLPPPPPRGRADQRRARYAAPHARLHLRLSSRVVVSLPARIAPQPRHESLPPCRLTR